MALKIKENEKLHTAIVKQLLQLSTAGFGLAAALAWNDTIRELIDKQIKSRLPEGEGISYNALYALIITTLAVLITYYLTKLSQRLEEEAKK